MYFLRNFGPHQLRSPKRRISAGTRNARTMVASNKTAKATPKPIDLIEVTPLVTKAAKTTASKIAAAVMMRAERCKPVATDSMFDFPCRCSSLILDNKKS